MLCCAELCRVHHVVLAAGCAAVVVMGLVALGMLCCEERLCSSCNAAMTQCVVSVTRTHSL